MQDWELIAKYIKGEATLEEQGQVELWLKADSANAVLLEDIKTTWQNTGKLNLDIKIDKAKAWASIQEKIKEEEKVIPMTRKAPVYNTWILRAAAVFIVGLFATWFFLKVGNKPEIIMVETFNERKTILLPDSSTIILNENSKLSYPKQFAANERKINLEGEAFFEIIKNPARPFVIGNKNFNVKVLGTSFNVLAYEKDSLTVVTVVTGTVSFTDKYEHSELLTIGDVGVLNKRKQRIERSVNSDLNFMAWRTKKLEFANSSIADICIALKKYFKREFIIKDKAILNCKFTGSFEDPKLADVLTVLEKTLNIKTVIKEKNVEITGTGC
ncbi:MAG: FecR domain-containing protein [Bacteroidetes bacterium]|nr:FecR domain-containing protein [Bacteroidota bacterium]